MLALNFALKLKKFGNIVTSLQRANFHEGSISIESRLSEPFKPRKLYGGLIMSDSIKTGYEVVESVQDAKKPELVSLATQFKNAVDTSKPFELVGEIVKSTRNTKFIGINVVQDNEVKAESKLIFTAPEVSPFSLRHREYPESTVESDYKLVNVHSFEDHLLEYASQQDGLSREEFAKRFPDKEKVIEAFDTFFNFKCISSDKKVVYIFSFNVEPTSLSRFYSLLALVSDLFIVKSSSEAVGFPWYDTNKAMISSMQHNMFFRKYNYKPKEALVFNAEIIVFDEGKAQVACTIKTLEDILVSSFSQLISLRISNK